MTLEKARRLILVGVVLLPATGSAQDGPGATLFALRCATCHSDATAAASRAPDRASLRERTPEIVLRVITDGSMAAQAQGLNDADRRALAEFVAGRAFGADPSVTMGGHCSTSGRPLGNPFSNALWNGWGADLGNSRFQSAVQAVLKAEDVPRLKLKWAFGFPDATMAYGQPTVAAGRVFVGANNSFVYSLDAASGCIYWSFSARAGVRTAVSLGASKAARSGYLAYFGDQAGRAYAVDAETGQLVWTRIVDDHAFARITGSPVLVGDRLYVPVASLGEENNGRNPKYECCTFRGSIVALDAHTGKQLWKAYSIPQAPKPTRKNSEGTQLWAPAGASIWSSPTVDLARRALYVGTGNSYTQPAVPTSDAILALDLETGKLLWSRQLTPNDSYMSGCSQQHTENCPDNVGPDLDFGSSPMLVTLSDARRLLIVGQKSGVVYALDPDHAGNVVWQFRAGKGGALGGIEFGMAADTQMAYVPVADTTHPASEAGGLFGLRLATGEQVWHTPAPTVECTSAVSLGCSPAQSAAITAIPGVVFSGAINGHMRAYSTADGLIVWAFDTNRDFATVNHVPAKGGSINGPGPAVAGGLLLFNSGYSFLGRAGNVLLAFGVE